MFRICFVIKYKIGYFYDNSYLLTLKKKRNVKANSRGFLPLCRSVALTLDSDHVNPQQSIEGLQCNTSHFWVSTL